MPIIYEVINLYNKDLGKEPWRYIGSDQHNKPKYFGSSKRLIKDIKILGKEKFEKKILYEFENISNVELRKIESNIQENLDVANDSTYYNCTNNSLKGYVETEEEKMNRMKKTWEKRKLWWDNLTEEERIKIKKESSKKISEYNKYAKGKTYEEICGKEKSLEWKRKLSGSNNHKSKKILDINTGKVFDTMISAMNYYGIKKYDTLKKRCLNEKICKFV